MDLSTMKSIVIPEGNVVEIKDSSGIILFSKQTAPTNLIPTAKDTDGSIYNGIGYADGYRINSSGNVVAYSYCTLTGLMPCDGLNDATRIYVKGLTFNTDDYYNGVALCDVDGNVMCSFRSLPNNSGDKASLYCNNVANVFNVSGTSVTLVNGVSTIIINVNESYTNYQNVKYFRLYGQPTGEEIVVTVNEEITDYK